MELSGLIIVVSGGSGISAGIASSDDGADEVRSSGGVFGATTGNVNINDDIGGQVSRSTAHHDCFDCLLNDRSGTWLDNPHESSHKKKNQGN